MSSLAQAWRALACRRTFTFTTVLTLAVGIGLTMAAFSIPRTFGRVRRAGAGRLVIAGVGAGLVLMLVVGQMMRALLFGVAPSDPAALAWSVAALALVAVAAVIVPARQAARVSAIEAMK